MCWSPPPPPSPSAFSGLAYPLSKIVPSPLICIITLKSADDNAFLHSFCSTFLFFSFFCIRTLKSADDNAVQLLHS